MKYTFEYRGKQKTVEIPEDYIKQQKASLGANLSWKEIVDLWLTDNDYFTNDEAQALTAKAKAAGVGAKADGKKRKAPVRKPDEIKRLIIQGLFEYIQSCGDIKDPQVTNVERMIAFTLGDDNYEITLTKKRKPKN